jgi:site-specific DNA-cytosine methylase
MKRPILRLLIGGSPCTHWSIAQKNNRETKASGIGWELFRNFLIAKKKFAPDHFLYENNKSAADPIKKQISNELRVYRYDIFNYQNPDNGVRFTYINSALLSAQNRERFYVTSFGDITTPEDAGIYLCEVIDSGITYKEKAYTLRASNGGSMFEHDFIKANRDFVAEPALMQYPRGKNKGGAIYGKSPTVTASHFEENVKVIEPINEPMQIGEVEDGGQYRNGKQASQQSRVYSPYAKSVCCDADSRKYYAIPINTTADGKAFAIKAQYTATGPANLLKGSNHFAATGVAVPVRIGTIESNTKTTHDSKPYRVYSPYGKAVTLQGEAGGAGAKTGIYAVPVCVQEQVQGRKAVAAGVYNRVYEARVDGKCGALTTVNMQNSVAVPVCLRGERTAEAKKIRKAYESGRIKKSRAALREWHPRPDGKTNTLTTVLKDNPIVEKAETVPGTVRKKIYTVKDGLIRYAGNQYSIKLPDGAYIIRKLSVAECRRLQTIPDWYKMPCSDTQNYKMLGNGWTVEVIKHLLSHIPNLLDYDVEVLSLYDGMSCGQIALKELGARVVKYVSCEIDKYCIETTQANFPDTIQRGDAFQVRSDNWIY